MLIEEKKKKPFVLTLFLNEKHVCYDSKLHFPSKSNQFALSRRVLLSSLSQASLSLSLLDVADFLALTSFERVDEPTHFFLFFFYYGSGEGSFVSVLIGPRAGACCV